MKKLLLLLLVTGLGSTVYSQCQAYYTSSSSGSTVSFTNASTGTNLSYNWSFGDGTNSSLTNPVHTYSPGYYNVCLTVSSNDSLTQCQDTYCDSLYFVADSSGFWCDASANVSSNQNGTITATATSTGASYFYWAVFNSSNGFEVYNSTTNPMNYNPGTSGTYSVCLTTYDSLQNFCDSTCYYVTTDSTSGLYQIGADEISVYPNPAHDQITVSTPNEAFYQLNLMDVSGALVRVALVTDEKTLMNLEQLPEGMYFIHALGREGQQLSSCKIIIR